MIMIADERALREILDRNALSDVLSYMAQYYGRVDDDDWAWHRKNAQKLDTLAVEVFP